MMKVKHVHVKPVRKRFQLWAGEFRIADNTEAACSGLPFLCFDLCSICRRHHFPGGLAWIWHAGFSAFHCQSARQSLSRRSFWVLPCVNRVIRQRLKQNSSQYTNSQWVTLNNKRLCGPISHIHVSWNAHRRRRRFPGDRQPVQRVHCRLEGVYLSDPVPKIVSNPCPGVHFCTLRAEREHLWEDLLHTLLCLRAYTVLRIQTTPIE